jgi:hypothetical protein
MKFYCSDLIGLREIFEQLVVKEGEEEDVLVAIFVTAEFAGFYEPSLAKGRLAFSGASVASVFYSELPPWEFGPG